MYKLAKKAFELKRKVGKNGRREQASKGMCMWAMKIRYIDKDALYNFKMLKLLPAL